jgi:hypothetical protein
MEVAKEAAGAEYTFGLHFPVFTDGLNHNFGLGTDNIEKNKQTERP